MIAAALLALAGNPRPPGCVTLGGAEDLWRIRVRQYRVIYQILDDELIARARGITGLQEKTALVHEGLRALIARESARRLAALGGSERGLRAVRRRRPSRARRSR